MHSGLFLAAVLAVVAHGTPAPTAGGGAAFGEASVVRADDEIVKEFRRYFKKFKDTPTRVSAVLDLLGTESTGVVDVLVPVLADKEPDVVKAAERVLASFETRPPVDHLLEVLAKKKVEPVRLGLLRAIAQGGYGDVELALVPCLEDKSWNVRRHALIALSAPAGGKKAGANKKAPPGEEALEAVTELCGDSEPAVRCAALEALAAFGSERVVPAAIGDLGHESWQVRASAIHSLGRVRHGDSIGPLIDRMGVEEGRLVVDIGAALAEITGRDFGHRIDAWQRFWKSYEGRFVIPTDAELKRLREKQKERSEAYKPPAGTVNYHGVETPSRSILFVIDQSGSMEQEVVDKERYKGGGYPSMQRMDIVKTELIRTIEGLEPYVKFNILAFATDIKPWKKTLVKAGTLNKASAKTFLTRLEALGGASKAELAEVGLTGAANLEAGKTNTFGALMAALAADDPKKKDKNYQVEVDTIFFLSDGKPSHGKYIDTTDILRELRLVNELRKVVIHTLAIGEFEKDFMRVMAEQNGGVFVDLGR